MFKLLQHIKSCPQASWLGSLVNQYPMNRVNPHFALFVNERLTGGHLPMLRGAWRDKFTYCPLAMAAVGERGVELLRRYEEDDDWSVRRIWATAEEETICEDDFAASHLLHCPVAYSRGFRHAVDGCGILSGLKLEFQEHGEYPSPLVYLLGRFDGYRMRRLM